MYWVRASPYISFGPPDCQALFPPSKFWPCDARPDEEGLADHMHGTCILSTVTVTAVSCSNRCNQVSVITHAHGRGVNTPSPASVMVKGRSRALTASPRDVASPKGIPNLQQRRGSFSIKPCLTLPVHVFCLVTVAMHFHSHCTFDDTP